MGVLDRRLLAALVLASMLAPLGSTSLAVAIPVMARELGCSPTTLTQWLVSSYLVVGIVLQSPGGKFGDLIGHRRALGLGQLVVTLGTLLGLTARSVAPLVLARVLMAAGGAAIIPSAMALARNGIPVERRARAFAAFGVTMGLAAALGPTLGGELTSALGWRAVFAPNLVILGLSAALARRGDDPEPARVTPRPRFDLVGSALLGAGLLLVIAGLRAPSLPALAAAAITLSGFARWERSVTDPVVDLALFRRASFTCGGLVVGLSNMAMYATLFELPVFFARARGIDAHQTGRALLGLMLAMVIASPVGARLSERFGARATVIAGLAVCASGLWTLRDGEALQAPGDALAAFVAMGAGLGLSGAPAQAAALADVPNEQSGMAAGVLSTLRYLGGVAGIAVLGALSRGSDLASVLAQHRASATVFCASLTAGIALAMGLPRGALPSKRLGLPASAD